MSDVADYRKYYERLSIERKAFRVLREQEIKDNKIKLPLSLIYYRQFKDKLYHQISKTPSQFKIASRILNMGCGQGEDIPHIRKYFQGNIYCLDISINQLLIAFEAFQREGFCRFVQSYAEYIPFKDASFDCVILSELIEHLPHPELALREILRVVKSKGYIFITTPNKYGYFHLFGTLIPLKIRRWLSMKLKGIQWDINPSKYALNDDMKEHISLLSPFSLRRLLNIEGFLIEEIHSGMLDIPFPHLFDIHPFLIRCWSLFDRLIDYLPFSVYLKSNFIVVAKKRYNDEHKKDNKGYNKE